jgi:hypothetical protein
VEEAGAVFDLLQVVEVANSVLLTVVAEAMVVVVPI